MTEVSPFETLHEGGNYCDGDGRMRVRLYPESPDVDDRLGRTGLAAADLRHTCETLLRNDAISYYRIETFDASAYGYPEIDDESNIGSTFEDYLTDGDRNGTGSNLMMYTGCHALVHGRGVEGVDYANALSADRCYLGEHYGYRATAFSVANVAWSGLPRYASDADKARAALIQEVLHTFIRANQPEVEELICDRTGYTYYDEHTLGAINDEGDVTPMLTFHVGEHAGCCEPAREHWGGYTTQITACTIDAVGHTAGNQCGPPDPGCQE